MILSDKKQVEWLLLDYFRQLYPGFPRGKVIPSESPDFIVDQSPRYKTGIELVRLHPANGKTSSGYTDITGFGDQFAGMVREVVSVSVTRNLFVKFLFSHPPVPGQHDIDLLARKTADRISSSLPVKSRTFFFRKLSGKDLLPALESILVINDPRLEIPVWECAGYPGKNSDMAGDILWSVRKKEAKIPLYLHQKLNQYWLLITTTMLRTSNGSDVKDMIENPLLKSSFHRIFLLDMMNARVTGLT